METRIFGKTGAKITFITMGGCGLGYVDQNEADKAVKLAMDHGINMIDVAPTYGNAEIRLKGWIEKYRNKFFLSEKTLKRKKNGAWRQLKRSLEKLGTSYFDLYQFHAVSSMGELKQILGENGAMEAFLEAKETGIIKNIGITAHDDVRVLQKALELSDDIDTVLLPVYVAAIVHPSPYEPLTSQELIDQAVWFTLSQEGVTTYSLPCDIRLWPLVLDAVNRFKKLTYKQQENVVKIAKENEFQPLFPE